MDLGISEDIAKGNELLGIGQYQQKPRSGMKLCSIPKININAMRLLHKKRELNSALLVYFKFHLT